MSATETTTMTPVLTLIGQGEYETETTPGVHHGLSIYARGDNSFAMQMHARSYDGVRVADKWDSGVIVLDATDETTAHAEANDRLRTFVRALTGAGA